MSRFFVGVEYKRLYLARPKELAQRQNDFEHLPLFVSYVCKLKATWQQDFHIWQTLLASRSIFHYNRGTSQIQGVASDEMAELVFISNSTLMYAKHKTLN